MSAQVPKSAANIYGGTSIPAQEPITHHNLHLRDEGYPSIVVPSEAPSTTPLLHPLRDRDTQSREDNSTIISIAPTTVDRSIKEARDDDHHGNPIQTLVTPEHSPTAAIDSGDRAVQSREHGIDPDLSLPKGASTTMTTEQHSVNRKDRVQQEDVPSTLFFQGSSDVNIYGSPSFYGVRGNATINNIRFGDDQFTDVQRSLICDHIANLTALPDIDILRQHVLTQSIISLPRAKAVFNDYQNKKKSGPCFKGTREALLREMADWATSSSESRMYILSGLAGIGKSTVAYTIASRAADLNLLGASFIFSRGEADRKNAEMFFSTIAYQLCVYDETFAKAIGDVLLTERGSAATTKDPLDQLQALILDPLRNIVQSRFRPILIVIDALDECDEDDTFSVLAGLSQLVRDLPSFKIILTTRPQPYLKRFLAGLEGHKIFHLQEIEDKVVDGDIRLYLNHSLSLEAVQGRYPQRQWSANNEEIDSVVRAAGRLFIIASTAVRYILDKSASNPMAQMQKLLGAFARYVTPFKDLDHFYAVVLRNVVPENCDNNDTVSRYQSVVGAIIFIQRPLPVCTLTHLINIEVVEIREVLDNLQSVILLGGDNVPRIYHKSFPDYLMDQERCKDAYLQVDARICHTQIATCCFEIMDKYLEHNILGFRDTARFMSNEDGFKENGITDEQIQEKIPQQLRYACVYWVNHLEVADIEDNALIKGLKRFADKHMLYWLEVLSLIGRLDSAHQAIGVVLKLLTLTSSELYQLLSDALRFISKFYETIKRSALHIYYSALPFTPTNSLLFRQYKEEAVHKICAIDGGPEKWDALVANLRHEDRVQVIKFSLDSTLLVSCSEARLDRVQGKSKIWDAATGTPIQSAIPDHRFAVSNDFSTAVSFEDKTITFYNVGGSPSGTMFITSSKIQKLALSSESSRVAAALSNRTICLWEIGNAESMTNFKGFDGNDDWSRLEFSPTGTRLAYSSAKGTVKLRDVTRGEFITDLQCESHHKFEFSGDGARIASLSRARGLTLWNSESGGVISTAKDVGQDGLAVSADGSLLATADRDKVTLWSENRGQLIQIKVLGVKSPRLVTFSLDNILAITTRSGIKLYSVKTHTFIHRLPLDEYPMALVFSPDCTRLAVGYDDGNVNLWDIRGIDASSPPSKGNTTAIAALALSRDCKRLACGFEDGTVELWGTIPTKQRIGPLALCSKMEAIFFRIFRQSRHTQSVRALGFDPDGRLFASGSDDGTIKLWNGGDGVLRGSLKVPGRLQAVALSSTVLVATWGRWHERHDDGGVTLWNLDTLRLIHTFKKSNDRAVKVSIAENNTLIAVFVRDSHVELLQVKDHKISAIFDVPFQIRTMTFLPDNSQLVVQSEQGVFLSFNLTDERITKGPTLEHLIQLPSTPLWRGVPVWHCQDKEQHYFSALFPQQKSPIPVLWIPRQVYVTAWTQGSSILALGCKDGRVILLQLLTS